MCGKAGDIAKLCPENETHQGFVCHACGKDGHIARHCLKKRRKDQEVVFLMDGTQGKTVPLFI